MERVFQVDQDMGPLSELIRRAGIGETVAYELANRNELPVPIYRVGKRFLYSRRAWDALVNAQHGDAELDEAA